MDVLGIIMAKVRGRRDLLMVVRLFRRALLLLICPFWALLMFVGLFRRVLVLQVGLGRQALFMPVGFRV